MQCCTGKWRVQPATAIETLSRYLGGSVCESNTPMTPRRCHAPVLKTGRITGSHALPRRRSIQTEIACTRKESEVGRGSGGQTEAVIARPFAALGRKNASAAKESRRVDSDARLRHAAHTKANSRGRNPFRKPWPTSSPNYHWPTACHRRTAAPEALRRT